MLYMLYATTSTTATFAATSLWGRSEMEKNKDIQLI